jgi:hypothetical protein
MFGKVSINKAHVLRLLYNTVRSDRRAISELVLALRQLR